MFRSSPARTLKLAIAGLIGAVMASTVVAPAFANVAGDGVVINEAYLKGGSAGAPYNKKFVELYNGGTSAVTLTGMSIQYRSATTAAAPSVNQPLTGTIQPNDYFLIQWTGNGTTGEELPGADQVVNGTLGASGTTGTLYLANTTTAVTLPTGSVTGNASVVDLIGYGASNTYEGAVVPVTGPNGTPNSLARNAAHTDTDSNANDFTNATTVTPQKSASTTPTPEPTASATPTATPTASPTPTSTPTTAPTTPPASVVDIAAIQGTGDASPLVGQTVTTRGVVTAAYPTGGFNGYVIQTPGTGTTAGTASTGLYVFSSATVGQVAVGDYVQVTGAVSEFAGLTELTVTSTAGLIKLTEIVAAPTPVTLAALPTTDAGREVLESMLVQLTGPYTVSNTYSTNQYAEIGLASGTTPQLTPTEVARPGTAAYTAAVADNAARAVTLDDGASLNFLTAANKGIKLPYLSDGVISVGAAATFTKPVVLDYRNNIWKVQPTTPLVAGGAASATFSDVRAANAAPKAVGGDVKIASFNVLNYFTTTGDQIPGCTTSSAYTDRAGNPITVNSCGTDSPRGAWNAENLARQQAKIVTAINALDADVVSLEEIENSDKFGKTRDAALTTLVAALNTAAGEQRWTFVPSPTQRPASEDVIRTAFIYKAAVVKPVGTSVILDVAAFSNARQPLAQEFAPVAGGEHFIAIVNHFKSKGSGTGADADQLDGQGASNASRVAQARALVTFSSDLQAQRGTKLVYLLGDFNSYTQEDPMKVLYDAKFTDIGSTKTTKYSYSFSGQSGSLDHVLASPEAYARVTGADIWNINAGESIAYEYSRYNYNATDFYRADQYRSSDHDPVVVGISLASNLVDVNLLNINDFHGRIDSNTVKFAGTIEQLRAQNPNGTVLLSAGDNIGASLFNSSIQKDQPTLDVLNALELKASAVGNHEFDRGFSDLTDRVIGSSTARNATWDYLGANVYLKGTQTPALPEYSIQTVNGVKVAVIGVVTQETPTLVSPSGVANLEFGDPIAAVNRVAAQLSDGSTANGEADVIVAEYHEGSIDGVKEGATLDQEIAAGGAFASIVTQTSANVDVIFTGHTHKQYAWDGPIPGVTGKTRPVLQTGSYGENIGQVKLMINPNTGAVASYTQTNVARSTTADGTLVSTYPRVAAVKQIVDAAIAKGNELGSVRKGSLTADITSAYAGGSTATGTYVGGTRDDRGSESTLGNLVADSLVSTLSTPAYGGAQIGVVNPGGLRAELLYKASTSANDADGVITYSEAQAVLPFANNMWTASVTGAQFKTLLEQQWQPTGSSRPFLNLGLSDNVTYTYDATKAAGSRVTGIWIDGSPISATTEYRIGTLSFLLEGGDNFTILKESTRKQDAGLVDLDAWTAYLESHQNLSPSFDRRGVSVQNAPTATVKGGDEVTFSLSKLDLTSLGSPVTTTLSATWKGSTAAAVSIPVTAGAASVKLTAPKDVTGATEVVLTAAPSGTVVRVPVTLKQIVPVELNLLNINDFHGRIALGTTATDPNTVKFAGTIEQLRAQNPNGTMLLSAGDNIGASLFASSSQNDKPTIDVLNALGLKASAVGNHEFDQGYNDLVNRVQPIANWDYLGANVYRKGTTTPALKEYATYEVNGLKVAVIGAVTLQTPSLVSPGGITDVTFGDPVAAVNRVAAQLTDGNLANGEADVIVAEYHEGAGDSGTAQQESTTDSVFGKIVSTTSAAVDVIFTGHSHKQYAFAAPVPGVAGKTRPVLQTGEYGFNIGQVVLTVDPTTGDVMSATQKNVVRTTEADSTLVSTYPRVAQVKQIVDAALAAAAQVGGQRVGTLTKDITTAYAGGSYAGGVYVGGSRDDRASESTLGDLVADSLVDALGSIDRGGATIGVVNPGGLRADLKFANSGSTGDADGVITYAEANAVLPFVNNLWTTSITGAQFKQVLEQQWQPAGASRSYLQLGLSSNVTYTADPSKDAGSRITSVWINGQPISMTGVYRIGSFNFLLQGGDNFTAFTQGTSTSDSGLVDRDAWVAYLQGHQNLAPDFARQGTNVTGVPSTVAERGSNVSFTVSKLDLTSLGSPENTTLSATWTGSTAAAVSIPVTGGTASVSVTVPADAPASSLLVLTAQPSGTVVRVPVAVNATTTPTPEPTVTPTPTATPTATPTPTPTATPEPTSTPTPQPTSTPTATPTPQPTGTPTATPTPTPTTPGTPGTGTQPPKSPIAAAVEALIQALKDLIKASVSSAVPGQKFTITVGTQHAGQWVSVWIHSTPTQVSGWTQVGSNGTISVTMPQGVAAGQHRLVVQDANNAVIGWTALAVGEDPFLAATGGVINVSLLTYGALSLLVGAGLLTYVGIRRRRERGELA